MCFLEPGQKHEWGDIVAPFCAQVVVVPLNKMRSYANCVTGVMSHRPLQVQYYMDPAMKDAVRQVVEAQQPDLLYAHTIRMGQYIEPYVDIPRVLAMQISMTLNYRRLAEQARGLGSKVFYNLESRKVPRFRGQTRSLFQSTTNLRA